VIATLPQPRIVVGDAEALERRARALAEPEAEEAAAGDALRVVVFRLGGARCAVDAAVVERAVVALAHPFAVPLASGEERTVAFVEERPVAVVDLAGAAGAGPRSAAALGGCPALVLRAAESAVAVVVDGPLELAEDRVVASAVDPDDGGVAVRIAGRLASGAALVDGGWLAAWAGKAVAA
jgi:chemotaxis signal transduction protein